MKERFLTKKLGKRIGSILCVCILLLTLWPQESVSVFAAGETKTDTIKQSTFVTTTDPVECNGEAFKLTSTKGSINSWGWTCRGDGEFLIEPLQGKETCVIERITFNIANWNTIDPEQVHQYTLQEFQDKGQLICSQNDVVINDSIISNINSNSFWIALRAGNICCNSITITYTESGTEAQQKIPTTSNFTFTPPSELTVGEPRSATVEPKSDATGMGVVTVYYSKDQYHWSTTPPSVGGTWYVTIDVAAGDSYTSAVRLRDASWNFTIVRKAYDGEKTASGSLIAEKPQNVTINLPGIPEGAKFGTINNSASSLFTANITNGNQVNVTANKRWNIYDSNENQDRTFTIPVTDAYEYNDYEITVTIHPIFRVVVDNILYQLEEDGSATIEMYNYVEANALQLPPEGTPIDKIVVAGKTYPVNKVSSYGVYGKTVASINLPNVEEVGNHGFSECSALTSVTLPKVKTIKQYGFNKTGIQEIYLPKIESIEQYAFQNCTNLKRVTIGNISCSVAGNAFVGVRNCELILPIGWPANDMPNAKGYWHGGTFTNFVHQHSGWIYEASDNKIRAVCHGEKTCSLPNNTVELTLIADSKNYPLTEAYQADFEDTTAWTGAGLTVPAVSTIQYYKTSTKNSTVDGEQVTSLTYMPEGYYYAAVKVEGKTAKAPFEITKDVIHTHGKWTYTASGNQLMATCSGDGDCDLKENKIALTLQAESKSYTVNGVYEATLGNKAAWKAAGLKVPEEENIRYYKTIKKGSVTGGKLVTELKGLEEGYYYASLSVEGRYIKKAFEITKGEEHPEDTEAKTPTSSLGAAKKLTKTSTAAVQPVSQDATQYGTLEKELVPETAYNLSKFVTTKNVVNGIKAAIEETKKDDKDITEIYTGKPVDFDKDVLKAIQDGQKTVVYYFAHNGKDYSITIPPTVEASQVLEKSGRSGPLYVGQQLGTVQELSKENGPILLEGLSPEELYICPKCGKQSMVETIDYQGVAFRSRKAGNRMFGQPAYIHACQSCGCFMVSETSFEADR